MELTPLLCSEMPLGKMETTRLKTLQPKSSIGLDSSNGRISGFRGRTKINFSESGSDSLEIEVASCIIDYLEKNGEVFILADIENPQYSYSKISGYDFDVDLRINFEKFVTISKTSPNVDRLDSPGMEFAAKTFGLSLDEQSEYCLASYAEKSGYPTVDDWLKALKYLNESSEGFIGNKLLYLYHIQVDSAFSIKCETQHILEG